MTASAAEMVREAAREAYPEECCGLLLGRRRESPGAGILRAVPLRNAAPDRARGYAIDPADLLAVESEAAATGLQVVGAFHSHPDGEARPSARDASTAVPGWTYAVAASAADAEPEVRWYYCDAGDAGFGELSPPEKR